MIIITTQTSSEQAEAARRRFLDQPRNADLDPATVTITAEVVQTAIGTMRIWHVRAPRW